MALLLIAIGISFGWLTKVPYLHHIYKKTKKERIRTLSMFRRMQERL